MPLLDTHVWAFSLTQKERLSARAFAAMFEADDLSVSAVAFYEISQKVRLAKWPIMAPIADKLMYTADIQGLEVIPVSSEIANLAGSLDWTHRDPFDRLIAATALVNGMQLISADTAFDSLIGLRRLW